MLFLRQRPTALLSVHEALLLVSRFVPNVCCCAGSLPLACSSYCTESSRGLDTAGVLLAPGRSSGWLSLALQVLVHTGHRPHLWRCLMAPGRQSVSGIFQPRAVPLMFTASRQCELTRFLRRGLPQACTTRCKPLTAVSQIGTVCKHCQAVYARHQPAARHKAVQACLLVQAWACHLHMPRPSGPCLHVPLVGAMLRIHVCSAAERQSRTCTTYWVPCTLQSST